MRTGEIILILGLRRFVPDRERVTMNRLTRRDFVKTTAMGAAAIAAYKASMRSAYAFAIQYAAAEVYPAHADVRHRRFRWRNFRLLTPMLGWITIS